MSLSEINLAKLFALKASGQKNILDFCMSAGLIAPGFECRVCKKPMGLKPRPDIHDGFEWRCQRNQPYKHNVKRTVRHGSMFAASHISIIDLLLVSYFWINKAPKEWVMSEFGFGFNTVNVWYSFCSEVCSLFHNTDDIQIGGDGIKVEIKESKFGKYNLKEKNCEQNKWIFEGIERETKNCFFVIVSERNSDTLLNIIKKHILPGTTVISDCWRAYDCLQNENFRQHAMNNSLRLKDFKTKYSSDDTEGEHDAKKRKTSHNTLNREHFEIAEHIWRKKHGNNFEEFLKLILQLFCYVKDGANEVSTSEDQLSVSSI